MELIDEYISVCSHSREIRNYLLWAQVDPFSLSEQRLYTHMQIPMLKCNGLAWRISLFARRLYVDHCIVAHRAICHESEIVFAEKYGKD